MESLWPPLPLDAWRPTQATLHRCAQMVGKIRLALAPITNHYWSVALHLTPRGLTTGPTPYEGRTFDLAFDLLEHELVLRTSDGAVRSMPLQARPVADLYSDLFGLLAEVGIHVTIDDPPVEIDREAIPFHSDRVHGDYNPEQASRWFRIVARTAVVLEQFRAGFIGKCSPVHFFWGSFDLACTRFSGRRAPERPGADLVTREAYSHECISAGFWPGDDRYPQPAFYSYTAPAPDGLADATVRPDAAFYHRDLAEFLLPYDVLRRAPSPPQKLLEFFQSTYDAGATLARWDRAELERPVPEGAAAPERPHPPG